ncbi:Non-catalytic module family DOC2, partial [Piromyces sp. E2]
LLLSAALVISKASACIPDCWAEKLGYKCCSSENPQVLYQDENGDWSIEDNNWCGILVYDHNLRCARLGYECCKDSNSVVATDKDGFWGVEEGKWC